jgi:hypothetical protein
LQKIHFKKQALVASKKKQGKRVDKAGGQTRQVRQTWWAGQQGRHVNRCFPALTANIFDGHTNRTNINNKTSNT